MTDRYRFDGGRPPRTPPTVSLSCLASRSLVAALLVIGGVEVNPGPNYNELSHSRVCRIFKRIPVGACFSMEVSMNRNSYAPTKHRFRMIRHPQGQTLPAFSIEHLDTREVGEFPFPNALVTFIAPEAPLLPDSAPSSAPLTQLELAARQDEGDDATTQQPTTVYDVRSYLARKSVGSRFVGSFLTHSGHCERLFEMRCSNTISSTGMGVLLDVETGREVNWPADVVLCAVRRAEEGFTNRGSLPPTPAASQQQFSSQSGSSLGHLDFETGGHDAFDTQELLERERSYAPTRLLQRVSIPRASASPEATAHRAPLVVFSRPPNARQIPTETETEDDTARASEPRPTAPPPTQEVTRHEHAPLTNAPPLRPLASLGDQLPPNLFAVRAPITWLRAEDAAKVADYRLPLPKISFLTSRLRDTWSGNVTNVTKGYASLDQTERETRVHCMLQLPAKLLTQTKARAGDRKMGVFTVAELNAMEAPVGGRATTSKTPEERTLNRATSLAIEGQFSRAVQTLYRPAVDAMPEEDAVALLRPLHPMRVEEVPHCPTGIPIELTVPGPRVERGGKKEEAPKEHPLRTFVRRLCHGKSAGPSGWTEELIRDAITDENADEWRKLLEDVVNARFDRTTLQHLRRCILVGLAKEGIPPGVRPLAMGEAFVKVAAKLLMSNQRHLTDARSVGAFQFAFRPAGVDHIIHKVRELIRASPSTHAVLVDCKNAFNTIRRKAIRDVLCADERLYSLRPMFNAFYVEPGELIVRTDKADHAVIASSEGVRQGDVLGPLLFCLGLKPAVDRMLASFHQQHPDKILHVFCYMDDITLVGDVEACAAAFELLKAELDHLSLIVNERKTITTSEAIAAKINCSFAECPKLLGAFVSKTAEKEKVEVDAVPQKHDLLFSRLPHLPAEVAYRLLVLCGVPRWAHMIRTHAPDTVRDASTAFTELATRSLAAILKIDYDAINPEVYRQIRLPVRHGGLGLHDWAELCEEAYEMSRSGRTRRAEDDEFRRNAPDGARLREDAHYETIMEEIAKVNKGFHRHLQNNSGKMSSRWLSSDITVASAYASNHFRCAVISRLRFAGPDSEKPATFRCPCGFPKASVNGTTNADIVTHFLGCVRNGGPTKRHHLVRDALAQILRDAGYSVKIEAPIDVPQDEEDLRMDIVAFPPNEGRAVYIDVTIPNTASRSSANKPAEKVLKEKEEEKKKRYATAAARNDCELLPFAMDVFGKMSKDTQSFLQSVVTATKARCSDAVLREAITYAGTTSSISKALALGNGACIQQCGRLKDIGVFLGRPAPTTLLKETEPARDNDNALTPTAAPYVPNQHPTAASATAPATASATAASDAGEVLDEPVAECDLFCPLSEEDS